MFRHILVALMLLTATSAALADPWKDNSDKRRGWKGGEWQNRDWDDDEDDWDEAPRRDRGRGYGIVQIRQGYAPGLYVQPRYPWLSNLYGTGGRVTFGPTYGGNFSGGGLLPEASTSTNVPYDGPGVVISNRSNVELNFTLDDRRQVRIAPGETMRLIEKSKFVVSFDRGSDYGSARYSIHEGRYDFTPTGQGWELYRQQGEQTMVNEPNPPPIPPVIPPVTSRSVLRPTSEELPTPRAERPFDGLPSPDDADLPPVPREY